MSLKVNDNAINFSLFNQKEEPKYDTQKPIEPYDPQKNMASLQAISWLL